MKPRLNYYKAALRGDEGSIVTRTAQAIVEWLVLSSGVTGGSASLWVPESAVPTGNYVRILIEESRQAIDALKGCVTPIFDVNDKGEAKCWAVPF